MDNKMVKKIFITEDLHASISCDECGKIYKKDVSTFIGHKHSVKLRYTCKCGHSASVILERRRYIRKPREFKGFIVSGKNKDSIMVNDLSRYGLKLSMDHAHELSIGDILCLEFFLDDPSKSRVTTHACVKRVISPTSAGCEFIADEHYDNLGKYFLFHF